jgi:alkylhydroperoxidase family enzyme
MSLRIATATAPYPPAVAQTLDRLKTPGDQPLSLFRTLARDERLFARFTGGGLLDPGHLTLREREIVIHRTCALNRCGYEWGVHAAIFAEPPGSTPSNWPPPPSQASPMLGVRARRC